jgi:hypothetical protein
MSDRQTARVNQASLDDICVVILFDYLLQASACLSWEKFIFVRPQQVVLLLKNFPLGLFPVCLLLQGFILASQINKSKAFLFVISITSGSRVWLKLLGKKWIFKKQCPFEIERPTRRKIRLIESNAQCHLTKLTCKVTLRQVFICLRPPPLLDYCFGKSSNFVGSKSGQIPYRV